MKCDYCGAEIEIHMVGYGTDHVCPNMVIITTDNAGEAYCEKKNY